jgi:RNase adaptor protein for sRNA GlmZ degradation
MSTPVLIIGKSGSGKSRSIVSLNPSETFVIASLAKDLPFRGWKKKYTPVTADGEIGVAWERTTLKVAVRFYFIS